MQLSCWFSSECISSWKTRVMFFTLSACPVSGERKMQNLSLTRPMLQDGKESVFSLVLCYNQWLSSSGLCPVKRTRPFHCLKCLQKKKNQALDLINNNIKANFTAHYLKQTNMGKLKGDLNKHGRSYWWSSEWPTVRSRKSGASLYSLPSW